MKRRTILAGLGTGGAVSLTGCLDGIIEGGDAGIGADAEADGVVMPSPSTGQTSGDDCGPADLPLTARFTREPGEEEACPDGATPSLALENVADEPQTVTIALTGDVEFEVTYTVEPGERIVERHVIDTAPKTASITVNEETYDVAWPERSCYRHGIAVTSDGIDVGWIEPFQGPGDVQHDCYAGDPALLRVSSQGARRTMTVRIDNLCDGTTFEKILDLAAGESEMIRDELRNGGRYDVTVAVDTGDARTFEFQEACGGVRANVDKDGTIQLNELAID